jgi:predicted transposase/invertase (TIGR01784 family)
MRDQRESPHHELAMRQRAIEKGRMGRQIEMAGAYQRGKKEGREEGCEEGRHAAKAEAKLALLATVQRMLAKGMSKEEIADLQGISGEELETLFGNG